MAEMDGQNVVDTEALRTCLKCATSELPGPPPLWPSQAVLRRTNREEPELKLEAARLRSLDQDPPTGAGR